MSNAVVSKAGVHCVGDKRNGYGTFLKTINDAGRRLSLVKCRDNFGAIDEPLALWPDVPTIGAYTIWDDADYNVDTAYNRIVEAARLNPKIKYWEYFNERDGEYQQQSDLYIGLMPRLAAAGLGLCMFNCASGTPKLPSEGGTDIYNHIARAAKYAKDHGYNVLLGLHEYVASGGTIGRYKTLADYLQMQNALIPIAITEWLFETHPGDSAFLSALAQYDQVYMPDSRVMGCATWTLGGGGWGGSNYQNALIPMGDYIASVAPVVTPPPATEPREFDHWLDTDTGQVLGTLPDVTLVASRNMNIKAITRPKSTAPATVTINVTADYGVVTGGGQKTLNALFDLHWSEA